MTVRDIEAMVNHFFRIFAALFANDIVILLNLSGSKSFFNSLAKTPANA
jgi:hypothetical protein